MQKNHQNRPLDEAQKALIAQLKNITTSDYLVFMAYPMLKNQITSKL